MDTGKVIKIHTNIPDPERKPKYIPVRENPYYRPEEKPIKVDNWPVRKKEDAEVDK